MNEFKQYPNSEDGVKQYLTESCDPEFIERLDLGSAEIIADVNCSNVWGVVTVDQSITVVVWLMGAGNEQNDYEVFDDYYDVCENYE